MLRASDKPGSYEDAFRRVQMNELKMGFFTAPEFVTARFLATDRGPENACIFVCEVEGEPDHGTFCDVDNLPPDLLTHHYEIIRVAVEYWREKRAA
jgi:hypothetical protein